MFASNCVFSSVKRRGMKGCLPRGVCDLEKTGNGILGSTTGDGVFLDLHAFE